MSNPAPRPLVGIPTSVMELTSRRHRAHYIGLNYPEVAAVFSGAMPVLLPSRAHDLDVEGTCAQIDGLLLSGGRANIEPHHYGGPPFPDDEPIDPDRDNMVLPLIRGCVDAGVPVFGTCRGLQEMNVALGGSLHYRIHLLPGKKDHRMPRGDDVTVEEIMGPKHNVKLTSGGLFHSLVGKDEVMVNSLHGQGVDRLADGLEVEAVSPDGVIEGINLGGAKSFAVGVQWHAEWKPGEHELSKKLFEAFGDAARERAAKRRNGVGSIG